MRDTMQQEERHIKLNSVEIDGEQFYKISAVDELRPFFMSIVSDSNHWMFISSNGGLTAGRKNAEHALFPYYTDDKITESAEFTGSKSIFQIHKNNELIIWEPFSIRENRGVGIRRNLYKNELGNKILFEEINTDLELGFQYQWNFSNAFGFVKKSRLINYSGGIQKIVVLDGIQNIVPYGVGSELQNRVSNLTDAYKRSELDKASGLGIFALSAIIVDKAEPSEALKATVAFSLGLGNPNYLLSSLQLKNVRNGKAIIQEEDIKGEQGAYFIFNEIELAPDAPKDWMLVANVNLNHSAIIRLTESIKKDKNLVRRVQDDIDLGTENLLKLVAAADGLQFSEDPFRDSRHLSNVLFNIMRGGVFDENYQIERDDFFKYLENANPIIFAENTARLHQLPDKFSRKTLMDALQGVHDRDIIRLATEYLPLKFSRRHGDPSRPWNKFSINTRSEIDGSKILDYEGNWRDIFQNWEALACSYPAFIEGMLFKFLNASTFDGYNPYRITKDGFDWETIEPDDPWSYIGYWGDHQIIYLLKFLEFAADHYPELLPSLFDKEYFVYANIPYKIKTYPELLENPKDTIDFDFDLDEKIKARRADLGADGALLQDKNGAVLHVNFIEKIVAVVLSKLSNFIPEGGIWMNTQRPEWNDANNALVGNGVSMVTLCYLCRFMQFFNGIIEKSNIENLSISAELVDFFHKIENAFQENQALLRTQINDRDRKKMLDRLGAAASNFRWQIYEHSFSGAKQKIAFDGLRRFTKLVQRYLEHSIDANKRTDQLYHGYNLMRSTENALSIGHLSEMLEGQVAVLSSGWLSAATSLDLLDALRASSMFRADQQSYMLYPNKSLPRFLQKNTIPPDRLAESGIVEKLSGKDYSTILEKDDLGNYHFNGNFKNANDLEAALNLGNQFDKKLKEDLLRLFEEVFQHQAFTGRSGTFFGYEGLGSIYWHMVSKLRLAVLETVLKAIDSNAEQVCIDKLVEHYYAITEGLGVHKSPEQYGAFPTDPYSHTPLGKGAQQPGMTGQVKEDILCRFGELGVFVRDGKLQFQPYLLKKNEFLTAPKTIRFFDVQGHRQMLSLNKNALFFTYCQIPVIYALAQQEALSVFYGNKNQKQFDDLILDEPVTQEVLNRNGKIQRIEVFIDPARLLY
ncbi:MAG: hypothetical protein H6574_02105 [Lewinellaceae bacterium]|nr:hypothetical protein [Lewinellaceae bacterium]